MTETRETFPPQHQKLQPGREHKMVPPPEYQPRYPGSGRLDRKVAFITGGDSGIGRAVAVLYAREGADVVVHYLKEDRDAEETSRMVEAEGGQCLLIRGDAGEPAACLAAARQAADRFGKIDVLVNNCAEQHPQEPGGISEAQLARTFRTNFMSYVHMTQASLPYMGEGTAIVNSTSVTAYRGSSHLIDYASTKGAIVAFTRSLALALADRGIRVNGVAPGPVWTPLIPASFEAERIPEFGADVPMGRVGQPVEIAPSYLFLACEDSSYMTGQVLHPNGGEVVGG